MKGRTESLNPIISSEQVVILATKKEGAYLNRLLSEMEDDKEVELLANVPFPNRWGKMKPGV